MSILYARNAQCQCLTPEVNSMRQKAVISALMIFALCPPGVFAAWNTCVLDAAISANASSEAIDVDSGGSPHIVYTYFNKCKYLYLKDSLWRDIPWTEKVCPYYRSLPELKLYNDLPNLIYSLDQLPDTTYGMKYSYYDGLKWNTETADDAVWYGYAPSMVFDSSGNLHVSDYYYSSYYYNSGLIFYQYRDKNTGWSMPSFVDNADPSMSSIALNKSGRPQIAYRNVNKRVMYAVKISTGWAKTTVYNSSAGYVSQGIDADDHVHMCFMDFTSEDLMYAYYDGVKWSTTTVDSSGSVGWLCRLVLDADGMPNIVYYDRDNLALKYARFSGGSWAVEKVADSLTDGCMFKIAIDRDKHMHIIFCDTEMKYITNDPAFPFPKEVPRGEDMKVENNLFKPSHGESATIIVNLSTLLNEVKVLILGVDGMPVRTLQDYAYFNSSQRIYSWDGKDDSGGNVAAGVYFARLARGGTGSEMKKLCVIR
jgi:hypothetical protein